MIVQEMKSNLSARIYPCGKASFCVEIWEGPRNSNGRRIFHKDSLTSEHSARFWASAFAEGWTEAKR